MSKTCTCGFLASGARDWDSHCPVHGLPKTRVRAKMPPVKPPRLEFARVEKDIIKAGTCVYVAGIADKRYRVLADVRVMEDPLPESPRGGWMP